MGLCMSVAATDLAIVRLEAGTAVPAWATAGVRVTTTNAVDLTMSGDHRKY